MIQYKHLSVAMFEGYAGTSASGFRAEVAAEEALARLADVVERYEDFKAGVRSSSPGGARTDNEFGRSRTRICSRTPGIPPAEGPVSEGGRP
ncbi:hypothetical protein [Streptomyces sp. PSAA01]|uniref:hypothetical protein n=1 Tax=Streptomyces sp. PSAA01 TaxID=2912762 RepID=UPI001F411E99|nr:hypothetical protein [Streptomyces sp. PSAA01]MCG0283932.1 hypothetical protein [Streptomyces sp. PSAA01]